MEVRRLRVMTGRGSNESTSLRAIYRTEGASALFAGTKASVARHAPAKGLNFLVFGAVKEARSRTKAALENVKSRALGEIFAAQEAGFVTETWRKQSDSRYRAFCGLLQSLLQSFEKATAAVVANPEAPAEPEVRTNVFHPSLGFNTLLSIPSRLSTDR